MTAVFVKSNNFQILNSRNKICKKIIRGTGSFLVYLIYIFINLIVIFFYYSHKLRSSEFIYIFTKPLNKTHFKYNARVADIFENELQSVTLKNRVNCKVSNKMERNNKHRVISLEDL